MITFSTIEFPLSLFNLDIIVLIIFPPITNSENRLRQNNRTGVSINSTRLQHLVVWYFRFHLSRGYSKDSELTR